MVRIRDQAFAAIRRYRLRLCGASLVGLLVILMLGLVEPISCILHCAILFPAHAHGDMSSVHGMNHANHVHGQHAVAAEQTVACCEGMPRVPALLPFQSHTPCVHYHSEGGSPYAPHVPLGQPFHEMVIGMLLLLTLLLFIQQHPLPDSLMPPQLAYAPPLRPPNIHLA